MIQTRQQLRGLVVGKMPQRSADALLQARAVVAVSKHRRIVVAFQEQRIAAVQHLFDVRRAAAGVRQKACAMMSVIEYKLSGFAGVVRYRKGVYLEAAQSKRRVAAEKV